MLQVNDDPSMVTAGVLAAAPRRGVGPGPALVRKRGGKRVAAEPDLGIDNIADVRLIGHGGFSTVYGARHTLLQRPVAIKVLNPLTKDSDRRRFERECEVMGQMSQHRSVVTVFNAGYSHDNKPYLVMELVEGGTLADQLALTTTIGWERAIDMLLPINDALGTAHRDGILHRDVKPENILFDENGPKLTDFGIASLRDATGATSTHITASWLHTAPETFDNNRDERSDLYSLASTLYELIVGRAPFWRADDESLSPLMMRLVSEPPPRLPAELGPAALDAFFGRALAKNPLHRPQTAAAFAADLDAIVVAAAGPQPPAGSLDPGKTVIAADLGPMPVGPAAPPDSDPTIVANAASDVAEAKQPAADTPGDGVVAAVVARPVGSAASLADQQTIIDRSRGPNLGAPPATPSPIGAPDHVIPGHDDRPRFPASSPWPWLGLALLLLATLVVGLLATNGVFGPKDEVADGDDTEAPAEAEASSSACNDATLEEQGAFDVGTVETVNFDGIAVPRCHRWTFDGRDRMRLQVRAFSNDDDDIQLTLENSLGEELVTEDSDRFGTYQERFDVGLVGNDEYRIILLVRSSNPSGDIGVFLSLDPAP